MNTQELVQQVINGLSLGSTYALVALGLAMVFSIMNLINFAHGELLTIGGYTMWALTDHGVPFAAVVPLTLLATTLAAVAMERIAFRPLRGASIITLLITSFAVSFFLQNAFAIGIDQEPQGVSVPAWLSGVIDVGDYTIPRLQVVTTAATIAALALLTVFLRRTLLGISMRAAAEDFTVARLMGVKANRVIVSAFAISGFLAGIAAILVVAQATAVDPNTGNVPIVKAFIAVVIGGIGSLTGAVAGGFALGFLETILQATLPDGAVPFRDAFALLILVGILFFRPQGLVGRRAEVRA
ncbi:MAG TPA: branched-chain amino acid ABC transporter permease [Gaiellaceae bacterium]|jgi:branched-chain amino acid transport system permease protein|nr:branched-chain amino acid ABC transporter permease [Gaiellaceae bacterium]